MSTRSGARWRARRQSMDKSQDPRTQAPRHQGCGLEVDRKPCERGRALWHAVFAPGISCWTCILPATCR